MNLASRLQRLEQLAEDEGNLLMPWSEWRAFKRMCPDEQREYIDNKLCAFLDEIRAGNGGKRLSN